VNESKVLKVFFSPQRSIERSQVRRKLKGTLKGVKRRITKDSSQSTFVHTEPTWEVHWTPSRLVTSGRQGCQTAYFQTPNHPILGKFWTVLNGRCWFILWPFGVFYCHLVYFNALWCILMPFCVFYCHLVHFLLNLVCCNKKHLANLVAGHS
jgi:hypothetical protein